MGWPLPFYLEEDDDDRMATSPFYLNRNVYYIDHIHFIYYMYYLLYIKKKQLSAPLP